jgi:uncharacterized protein YkwD
MSLRIFSAVLISLFVLFSCGGPVGLISEAASLESPHYSEDLLGLINQYRISRGLHPLSSDNKLTALAESHSHEMYQQGSLNHDRFDERFSKSGCNTCVENVGWNYSAPKDQFNAWKDSREHNRNMLNPVVSGAGISRIGPYVTFFACSARH